MSEFDKELIEILRDMVAGETEPCRYDHHGYCQTHMGGAGSIPFTCATRRARQMLRLE